MDEKDGVEMIRHDYIGVQFNIQTHRCGL